MRELQDIPDFENYAVTQDGRVWSKPRRDYIGRNRKGKYLKPGISNDHLNVYLCRNGVRIKKYIYHLVLEVFMGACPEGMECRHLDGNPRNNCLSNLKWGTHTENMRDSIQHGTHPSLRRGSQNNCSKLTEQDVKVIRYLRGVAKFKLKEIAWQFDVTESAIWRIIHRKTWSHV